MISSGSAFPRRTEEHWAAQIRSYSTREKFVNEHATRFTQLSHLPYFSIVCCVVVDPTHNLILGTRFLLPNHALTLYLLSTGLIKTHFFHIWVQCRILRPNHEILANVSTLIYYHDVSDSF